MRDTLRLAALGLFTGALLVLVWQAPGPVFRELTFAALILVATLTTRSMAAGSGLSAFGLGGGLVVLLVIGAGHLVTRAGLDTSEGVVNWGLIPVLEEALKVSAAGAVALLHMRRQQLSPNPSDLLMLGCLAGAGFALAENSLLVQNGPGVASDMAWQYGPHVSGWYLVPAWGSAGYVGHAAATGFITGGYGLGLSLRRRLGVAWWAVPVACAAWIVLEHLLTNLYVGTGSRVALVLGNGRLTPWLFVLLAIVLVALDVLRHRAALRQSARLRLRVDVAREALVRAAPPVTASRPAAARLYLSQLRLVNATAWSVPPQPPPHVEKP